MDEGKKLAIKIRRMLLTIVDLLEIEYKLGKYAEPVIQEIHEDDSVVIP